MHDFSEQCSATVIAADGNARWQDISDCIANSGGTTDGENSLLEAEVNDPGNLHYAPVLIVNDAVFESQLSCSTPNDLSKCAPLNFICMMFPDDHKVPVQHVLSQPRLMAAFIACDLPDITRV